MAPHFIIAAVIPKIVPEAPLLPRAPAKPEAREATADPLAYAGMGAAVSDGEVKRDASPATEGQHMPILIGGHAKRRVPAVESHREKTQGELDTRSSKDNEVLQERAHSPQGPPKADNKQGITKRQLEEEEIGFTPRDAQGVGPLALGAGMSNSGISGPVGFDKREADAELGFSKIEGRALSPFGFGLGVSPAT